MNCIACKTATRIREGFHFTMWLLFNARKDMSNPTADELKREQEAVRKAQTCRPQ